jgi:predicted DNA-binding protein
MTTSDTTLSLRVPGKLKDRLERASARTQRSRAYLTIAALEKYLGEVERSETAKAAPNALDVARHFAGIGVKLTGRGRTAADINAAVDDFRGNE